MIVLSYIVTYIVLLYVSFVRSALQKRSWSQWGFIWLIKGNEWLTSCRCSLNYYFMQVLIFLIVQRLMRYFGNRQTCEYLHKQSQNITALPQYFGGEW